MPLCLVPSSRTALARPAARFYGEPARELRLIGFTGTFGKTGTSDVLRLLLDGAGRRTGVVGSLGARYDGFTHRPSDLTTPAPCSSTTRFAGCATAAQIDLMLMSPARQRGRDACELSRSMCQTHGEIAHEISILPTGFSSYNRVASAFRRTSVAG